MKKIERNTYILFIIIGIVILIAGVFFHKNLNEFKETAKETNATITRIEYEEDIDGDIDYEVYVEFYVKGEIYTGKLDEYNSTMREGDNVRIYYDPSNPNDFKSKSSNWMIYLLYEIGGIFALIGGIFLVNGIRKGNKVKKLKESGFRFDAEITGINTNNNYTVNGRHPYIIECSGAINGVVYNFKSENVWYEAPNIYNDLQIKTIPVYINMEKTSEYYVDIESYQKYLQNKSN